MRIKGDCDCSAAGHKVTEKILKEFVFYQIQLANTNQKERAIIIEGDQLSGIDRNVAIFMRSEILATVKVGTKKVEDVKFSRQIL